MHSTLCRPSDPTESKPTQPRSKMFSNLPTRVDPVDPVKQVINLATELEVESKDLHNSEIRIHLDCGANLTSKQEHKLREHGNMLVEKAINGTTEIFESSLEKLQQQMGTAKAAKRELVNHLVIAEEMEAMLMAAEFKLKTIKRDRDYQSEREEENRNKKKRKESAT